MKWTSVARLTIVAFALAAGSVSSAQLESQILGILEDTPGLYYGQPHYRSVRVVFYKDGRDWKAFPSRCQNPACLEAIVQKYPKQVTWTVAFDGKSLRALTTTLPPKFQLYATVGQEKISSDGEIPAVGKPSEDFGGFLGEAVYRPLVANSRPFFNDPEKWKHAQLSATIVSGIRQQFRVRFPKVSNCLNPQQNTAKQWHYDDENIKVTTAYSSSSRWYVARVELNPYRCDGPADEAFVDQWFVIAPDSTIRFLGRAMWLVDAGDYDNDGRSELVFSIDDYNRGGYRLFYDDFKKSATFEFGYH